MSLADRLAAHAREGSAGAASYRGFTYQHHWTLCKLLEVHESSGDYFLLVDHHDDVIVWDDPPGGSIRCFQIKVKARGNWTTAALVKREGEALSVLGKLYHHRIFFGEGLVGLEFISNARFSVGRLSDGSASLDRVRIQCTELGADVAANVRKALQKEHSLSEEPGFEGLVHLERSVVPIEAFREYTLGRVTDMLEDENGGQPVRAKAAYNALMDEIERRASIVATAFPPEDALERKSIGRTDVQEMLSDILEPPRHEPWPAIVTTLTAEGYGLVQIARLRRAYGTLMARRTGPDWDFVERLVERAHELVMALEDTASLGDCFAAAVPELRDTTDSVGLSEEDLRLIVIEALHNA